MCAKADRYLAAAAAAAAADRKSDSILGVDHYTGLEMVPEDLQCFIHRVSQ
jgi:hypothetical protein